MRRGGYAILTTPNGGYFRNQLPKFSDCADPSIFDDRQNLVQMAPITSFYCTSRNFASLPPKAGWRVEELHLYAFLLNGHCRTEPLLRILPGAIGGVDALLQRLPRVWRRRLDVGLAAVLSRP